jgi:hypothetical protein
MTGHPVRVRVAKLVFREEGQALELVEGREVAAVDLPEVPPVRGVVGGDASERRAEPRELERRQGLPGAAFLGRLEHRSGS